jgi:hypothetical protein
MYTLPSRKQDQEQHLLYQYIVELRHFLSVHRYDYVI